jgi:hypothetical protein
MKCVPAGNTDTCQRCHRSGLPCVFLPRANAATLPNDVLTGLNDGNFKEDVLHRLKVIEDTLGISTAEEAELDWRAEDSDEEFSPDYRSLSGLWGAVEVLEKSAPNSLPSSIWYKSTIKQLWLS